ncbi:Membrane protein, putative [Olavius algarvensis associated proteobacterium Delta 3]|nr:Membrane protein, putative [Olavius algarvensis associated proteobacterium Delta 3]CAB5143537.1 Membrane protein, putative [Olavius algarvensis associated proteobacterium Delta 3]
MADRISNQRLPALDALRGIVIVLMALDHASFAFNAGKYATDSAAFYTAGARIPEVQFFIRWVTHICAPTFLFLAGFALCLSITGRLSRGASGGGVDRYLFTRGLMILLLDPLWMSIGFGYGVLFQVLYAIGGSMIAMIVLRRLNPNLLLSLSLGYLVFSEVFAGLALWAGGGERSGPIGAFLVTGGKITDGVFVLYPLLPWLAYMALGWSIGNLIITNRIKRPFRFYVAAGLGFLVIFLIFRGLNGYGNMVLYRYGTSLVQWLHVSKYPPSLTFSALELGLMFLLLAGLTRFYENRQASAWNPVIVFGQTPLFFYILHVHLLAATAKLTGLYKSAGLMETALATFIVLIVLYPLCIQYRKFKRAHPHTLLKYV